MNLLKSLSDNKLEPVLALGVVAFIASLTYGSRIANLGFYLDDWYILWAGRSQGSSLIAALHAFDRPLMGQIFGFTYSLFGDSALSWQAYVFILRLGSAWIILWTLRLIWPEKRIEATTVAILALIYPGFLEQPNALTYSNHIGTYFLALLSIALSIKGVQTENRLLRAGYHLGGALLAGVYMFYVEFMIGLEGLRLCLIWLAIRQDNDHPVRKDLSAGFLSYLPYAAPALAMVIWRAFIFQSGRPAMDIDRISAQYLAPSIGNLRRLVLTGSIDLLETGVFAWFTNAFAFLNEAGDRAVFISLILAGAGMAAFIFYALAARRRSAPASGFSVQFPAVGLFSLLAALAPIILVGREIRLDQIFNGFNRYTLPATVGVGLFITGLIGAAIKERFRPYVIAGLIGLSVLTHYHNGLRYETAWAQQKNLWWQAAWRIPDLRDGTLLVAVMPAESRFLEGYEAWAPANIIYRPGSTDISITGQILNEQTRDWFLRGRADQPVFRGAVILDRDYDNTLILSFASPLSCLHVLDGEFLIDNSEESIVLAAASVSSHARIVTSNTVGAEPPEPVFGPEPDRTWCYFFQKLELARQEQDWPLAARLADEALAADLKPLNPAEWFPVIAAYLHTGRSEEARELAKIIRDNKELRSFLCSQLESLAALDGEQTEPLWETLCANPQ